MNLLPSHHQAVVALIVGGVAVGCAYADEKSPDKLKLRADVARNEDSNFLRSPDNKAVGDIIDSQKLDLNVGLPYGQQQLDLELNVFNSRHQTLRQFDFTGQSYNAGWRWSLTPTLLGVLGTKHIESLNSAADSIDPTLRNKNVSNLDSLTVGYLLGGPWQLLGEYAKGSSANERAVLGVTDIHFQSTTAGLSYVPSAGNSLSYARRVDAGTGISDYSYNGHAFVATYAVTSNTSLKGRLSYLEQRFSIDPKFDFSGVTGGLDGTWRITGKTSIAGGWQRDLVSFQTQDSTYARIDTLSVSPSWQMLPTLSLSLQYRQGVRDSLGNPNGVASTRQDRTRDTLWTLHWQPRSYVSLRTTAAQYSRTSNVAEQDFDSHVLTIGAQFTY